MMPINRTIYATDAEAVVSRLASSSFSLVYLNPPRNSFRSEKSDSKNSDERYVQHLTKLIQASKRLLCDRGSLYFHTSPDAPVNYRLILDQVFQRTPSLVIAVKRKLHGSARPPLGNGHDEILRYNKTDESTYNLISKPVSKDRFSHEDSRGPYLLSDITSPSLRPALAYTWRGYEPPQGRSWRFTLERMEQFLAEGRIVLPERGRPSMKRYHDETIGEDIGTLWDDISDLPRRPSELLSRIIRQASDRADWLLAPFASSEFVVQAESLHRNWAGCIADTESISEALTRFSESTNLSKSEITVIEAKDLQSIGQTSSQEADVFTNISDLRDARIRSQQVATLLSEIRLKMRSEQCSDEDILHAMLQEGGKISLLISRDVREDCQRRLSMELPEFERLSPTSKDFLATALFTLETLPKDLDYSLVSVSAWKAIELELAEQIFSPFKLWFASRHAKISEAVAPECGGNKKSNTEALAKFLKGNKDMPLGAMLWNLNFLPSSGTTLSQSLCLTELKEFVDHHFIQPGFFLAQNGIGDILSQQNVDRYRNGAAHTTLFSRAKAEESWGFVKGVLPELISGLQRKPDLINE